MYVILCVEQNKHRYIYRLIWHLILFIDIINIVLNSVNLQG